MYPKLKSSFDELTEIPQGQFVNLQPGRSNLANLKLAKKPDRCLEYVVVHELVHLIERRHNDRFIALMDQHLPQWRPIREELNSTVLDHQTAN